MQVCLTRGGHSEAKTLPLPSGTNGGGDDTPPTNEPREAPEPTPGVGSDGAGRPDGPTAGVEDDAASCGTAPVVDEPEGPACVVCGKSDNSTTDSKRALLGCDGCSNYQHAGCFADEDGVNDPGVHVFCVDCSVVCLACKGRHSTASNPLIKCDASGCDRAQHAMCCDPPLG